MHYVKRLANNIYLWWGVLLLGLIILSDIGKSFVPALGRAGVVWWGLTFAYIGIYAASSFAKIVHDSRIHKTFYTLAGLCVWIALIGFYLTNAKSLSGETTQEIACVLNHFATSSDWGFGKTCLFGYPARQFIIPALPSALFGRSFLALNLGGALYFLTGLIIFAKGLVDTVTPHKIADKIGLLALAIPLHFHFVIHTLFVFEQSIFPISFALMGTGLWLTYMRHRHGAHLLLFTFVILYTLYTYTPALALTGLGFTLLTCAIFLSNTPKHTRIFAAVLCGLVLISAVVSIFTRSDVAINTGYPEGIFGYTRDLGQAVQHLAFSNMRTPFMSPVITWIFILAIIVPFFTSIGKPASIISVWIVATLGVAIYAKGYTFYNIDFRLQRLIVVIPVLIASVIYTFRHIFHVSQTKIITLCALFLLITGLAYTISYQHRRPINPHVRFIQWIQTLNLTPDKPLYLMHVATPENNLQSVPDAMKYFHPTTMTIVVNDKKASCNPPTTPAFIIYNASSICTTVYIPTATYEDIYTKTTLLFSQANSQ